MAAQFLTVEFRFQYSTTGDTEPGPYAINTWHYAWDDALAIYSDAQDAASSLTHDWYDQIPSVGTYSRPADYLSPVLSGHVDVRVLDRRGGGVWNDAGFYTLDLNPTSVHSADLAGAVCLTSKCAPHNGLRRQSLYNRIYFGPLNDTAVQTFTDDDARPQVGLMHSLVSASEDLVAASSETATWVVYSPTGGTGLAPERVWVDNALDTQRRRGLGPTSRIEGVIG